MDALDGIVRQAIRGRGSVVGVIAHDLRVRLARYPRLVVLIGLGENEASIGAASIIGGRSARCGTQHVRNGIPTEDFRP
jgi:hypothetical protein